MYYAGLDIHKAFTYGVVKSLEGETLHKGKFKNSDEEFTEFFKDFPSEETKVVIESCCVWEHIYEKLEGMGFNIILANPVKTKAIAFAKIKADSIDASTLADLLRANLVPESYVPDKEVRRLRDVVRQRKTLVKGRTQVKNKIHAILLKHGVTLPYKTLCPKAVDWLNDNLDINTVLVSYMNILKQYSHELKFIEDRIKDIAQKDKQATLLMTVPGIGPIRSVEILAEIADIGRFPNASKLCCYAGLVPSIRQSGNSLRFGRLIKQASRSLKNALIEASWIAVRTKEANSLQLYFHKLKSKKGKQKAICATARKMLCIIHAMLRKNQEFIA